MPIVAPMQTTRFFSILAGTALFFNVLVVGYTSVQVSNRTSYKQERMPEIEVDIPEPTDFNELEFDTLPEARDTSVAAVGLHVVQGEVR